MPGDLMHIAEGLWTQNGDRIRLFGIPFDTRATIAKLPNGTLWLHSPVKPTAARLAEVRSLGPIAHIIAPNRIHGAFTTAWAEHAPKAQVWVSPKFPDRHPDIRYDHLLTDTAPPDWSDTLDQCLFAGHAYLDEVVFLHRPSATLIVTDIYQRHDPATEPALWRILKGLAGMMAPKGAMPPDLRLSFTDKIAARAARDRILGWEFDRILLPHSVPVETGGKAALTKALAWLD